MELIGKEKGYNSIHGPKRVKKTFSMILEGILKCYDGGEKMESHQKGFLKLKYFSALKILTSPLFEEALEAFLFLPLFSSFSFFMLIS
jgi:hypothetical protein